MGEYVRLSTKKVKSTRTSRKLRERYTGPFEIQERIGSQAYILKLPKTFGKVHNVFHVSLLVSD